ncbi:PPE family, PPE8 domain protein [Mycobacterium kansasii 732]|nr:PPE family, PPE8 domain protein [Mycobacterium kansasii 732]
MATAATVVGDGNSGVAAMADGRINVATAATVVGDGNSGVVAGADGSVNVVTAATAVFDGNQAITATAVGDTNVATAGTVVGYNNSGDYGPRPTVRPMSRPRPRWWAMVIVRRSWARGER